MTEAASKPDATADATERPKRALKPNVRLREIHHPTSDAADFPGPAAIGKRVRVYWPDDNAWFTGVVRRFDPRTGMHSVWYDDGDREQLLLAAEQFEWVGADRSLGGGTTTSPRGAASSLRLALASAAASAGHARGARALVRAEQTAAGADPEWPRVGDLIWGHVKGHGWWPGRVVESTFEKPVHLASNAVAINFFDNTSGWLPRHDCLPFVENFAALHSRKAKLPTFLAASRMARRTWIEMQGTMSPAGNAPLLSDVRVTKRQRSIVGGGAATRIGAMSTRRRAAARSQGAYRHRRRALRVRSALPTRAQSTRAGAAMLRGVAANLGDMTHRLVALDERLKPLVEHAQTAVADELQLLPTHMGPSKAAAFADELEIQERKLLLAQLTALHTEWPACSTEIYALTLMLSASTCAAPQAMQIDAADVVAGDDLGAIDGEEEERGAMADNDDACFDDAADAPAHDPDDDSETDLDDDEDIDEA